MKSLLDRLLDALFNPPPRLEFRITLLMVILFAILMLTSCASPGKRTLADYVPPAGCSERAASRLPPPPPNSVDYREWAIAYVGALAGYEDSENKRAATADCLDRHRAKRPWWKRK